MFCWTLHRSGGTLQGCGPAAVAVENKVYCFGGSCDGHRDQLGVNVFNSVSLRWRKLPPVTPGGEECHLDVPTERAYHTAVLIEDIIYIWGGCWRSEYYNVLYAFDVDTHRWFKPRVSGTVPEERYQHSACVLRKVMFIHGGGYSNLSGWNNDTYKLDTSTLVWTLINTRGYSHPATVCHSATIIGTKMFVFGGWGRGQHYNTIRVFDTETNIWLNTPFNTPCTHLVPEGHWSHKALTYNGELYICIGSFVWKFSPGTFSWKKVEPKGKGPSPMVMDSKCCCMVGDRVILFGGYNTPDDLYLDFSPSLKTICKLAVIQYSLEQSELPHNIRWELAAMP